MKTIPIACIVGARPNFMKIAPLMEELRYWPCFTARLIHTGQHFSPEMSASFFRDLGMPEPDENLEVGSGTQIEQAASIMTALERSFGRNRPGLVLVVGDVTSTLAAALVASKLQIPLGHVEAGLRSFDRGMPEEVNRVVTDALSDYLFVSEPSGMENLRAEGVQAHKLFFVGNVMIDSLVRFLPQALESTILTQVGVQEKSYALATLHRPANVDDPLQLRGFLNMLTEIAKRIPVVFPVHPRTRQRIEHANLDTGGLILTPPLGYLDFLRLMSEARFVLTDSGGIQEETTVLHVPCLTLRDNTERPVTIEVGTNRLVGTDAANGLRAALELLDESPAPACTPELWDGNASARIVAILAHHLAGVDPNQRTRSTQAGLSTDSVHSGPDKL
jgi:UDP-N-acetylglucosamine 2-epimerase (non-hydrolysing)